MMQDLLIAASIVEALQAWIENTDDLSSIPMASCRFAATVGLPTLRTLEIMVGDTIVWSSEENEQSELTFEFCRDAFLDSIKDLLPFINKRED